MSNTFHSTPVNDNSKNARDRPEQEREQGRRSAPPHSKGAAKSK
jgi:hypothetical protein